LKVERKYKKKTKDGKLALQIERRQEGDLDKKGLLPLAKRGRGCRKENSRCR